MSSTSRIGTPLRINCANVREKRDMQILWISGPKIGSFSFHRSAELLAAGRTKESPEAKKCAAENDE